MLPEDSDGQGRSSLDEGEFIRHKMYGGERSVVERYAELVIGEVSWPRLALYEVLTSLLGPIPGALGLLLRRVFYPLLFPRIGRGVTFGRSLTLRNPQRIRLGDQVVIDDYAILDGRGGDDDAGVVLGDRVIVNRGACIQAKVGSVRIGSDSDIGADTKIVSQGGVEIAEGVGIAGACKIGGGLVRLEPTETRERLSRGPVRIGARSVFGMGATVLDGVVVGSDCVVGAGAILRESVPDSSAAIPVQKLMNVPRSQFSAGDDLPSEPARSVAPQLVPASSGPDRDRIARVVYAVLKDVNLYLDPELRIAKLDDAFLTQPEGPLDSLGLINLIVDLEEMIENELGCSVNLADTRSLAEGKVNFTTVGTLVDYVSRVLATTSGGLELPRPSM